MNWQKLTKLQDDVPVYGEYAITELPDGVSLYLEYAEPGYSQPRSGIVLADWNGVAQCVQDFLEAEGYELEWDDEWAACERCGKLVRIQPNSWMWSPFYKFHKHDFNWEEFLCLNCAEEAYQEDNLNSELEEVD